MKECTKAVFIPIDNNILNLFKGFILDGKLLPDVKESDVYIDSKYYETDFEWSKTELIFRFIIIILTIPLILSVILILFIVDKFSHSREKTDRAFDGLLSLIFEKRRKRTRKIKRKKFNNSVYEDVPAFLDHCKSHFTKVIIYSYNPLTPDQGLKIKELIQSEMIYSIQVISKLSDLSTFIQLENISILNSLLVVTNVNEKSEAQILGFHTDDGIMRNVELFRKRQLNLVGEEGDLEKNSCETIIEMCHHVEYYLKTKGIAFFKEDSILFIEDYFDPFLNDYIKKNLQNINVRLVEKGMHLIYFPLFQSSSLSMIAPILEFLRYRAPILYSFTDEEIEELLIRILSNISSSEFYKMVLDELDLPTFQRPCLLRILYGGEDYYINKFTYKPIEYKTHEDLDKFFDWYITQITITDNSKHVHHYSAQPPAQYDADWYFGKDPDQDTEELKQKIDEIKKTGKYGVLVEAIMYMLATIKEDQPDIINKVKPLLEKKQLLESKVILSPIVIDKHYNILLPDFGNIEVKMHALPKNCLHFVSSLSRWY